MGNDIRALLDSTSKPALAMIEFLGLKFPRNKSYFFFTEGKENVNKASWEIKCRLGQGG